MLADPTKQWKPEIKIPDKDVVKSTSYVKMVIYSLPGAGKSTTSATANLLPEMKEVLHINTGDEISALKNAENVKITGTDIVGIPEPHSIDFESVGQMERLRWWLLMEEHPYKTVVIDTISRIDQIVLDQVVEQSIKRNPRQSNGAERDINDTNRDDYGKRSKAMKRLIGNYRDLPMNVIILAHQRKFENEGMPAKYGPDLSENISDALCGAFNIVGLLKVTPWIKKGKDGKPELDKDGNSIKEIHRTLVFEPTNDGFIVKDRTPGGKLGKQITDPTMKRIYDLINQ